MEQSKFNDLMAALTDAQEDAMDDHEEHSDDKAKHMYFLGKDVGLAEAKNILREYIEVER